MTKKKKWIILLSAAAVLLLAVLANGIWNNSALGLTEYAISSPELPAAFDGFRIAQVSDLHNQDFGENNRKLVDMLRAAQPDIIVITGDMVDSRFTDIPVALAFAEQAVEIAPCYYITGNHESRIEEYSQLRDGLLDLGVVVMENERVELQRDGDTIYLLGIHDVSFHPDYDWNRHDRIVKSSLKPILVDEGFSVLLIHRPSFMDLYAQYEVDLVLSGHIHGGQIRLPWIGALYAPGQGFFPEYDAGLYRQGDTQMIVSRGIGNSLFPLRINNPPEVVLVTLTQD